METKGDYNLQDELDSLRASCVKADELAAGTHVSIIDDLYDQLRAALCENEALHERVAALEAELKQLRDETVVSVLKQVGIAIAQYEDDCKRNEAKAVALEAENGRQRAVIMDLESRIREYQE